LHDVLDDYRRELQRMRQQVGVLQEQMQQFRRARIGASDLFRQVRWAQTCSPTAGDYPESGDNPTVFPIRFLDAHFEPTIGLQSLDTSARQTGQATVCYSATFLALGTTLPVFWLRGLGEDGDEGEWFAFPQTSSTPAVEGIPFVNLGSEQMLPYDPMDVIGSMVIDSERHLIVQKPTTVFKREWLINGADTVPFYTGIGDITVAVSRGFWRKEASGPVAIYPGAASLVFAGMEMGVSPHVQRLDPHYPGFRVFELPYTKNGRQVVDAIQRPVTTVFGKTRTNPSSGPQGESGGKWYQNAGGTATAEFDIWIRGDDGKRRVGGFEPIEVYLTFLAKNESVEPGTWGRADNYTHDYLRWEGDFACDKDDLDTAQQGGGQGQEQQQFTFEGLPTSDSTNQLIQQGIIT
jgi:hypothetical protein